MMVRLRPNAARNAASPGPKPDTPPPAPATPRTPSTGRVRPSLAQKIAQSIPTPRPGKIGLRSRFRKTATVTRRALRLPTEGRRAGGSGRLTVWVMFSPPKAVKKAIPDQFIGSDTRERWALIEAGKMPPDEDVPPLLDEEEQHRAYLERIQPVENETRREEEAIKEAAAEAWAEHQRAAQAYERQAFDGNPHAYALADDEREAAQAAQADAARQLDALKEVLDERRDEEWAEVLREAQERITLHESRIEELKKGLHAEIEQAINRDWMQGNGMVELERWELN